MKYKYAVSIFILSIFCIYPLFPQIIIGNTPAPVSTQTPVIIATPTPIIYNTPLPTATPIPTSVPTLTPAPFNKPPYANTQIELPANLYLADIDKDGLSDFIQIAGNRLLAFKINSQQTGILHAYFDREITKLITGDYKGLGYDQILISFGEGLSSCFVSNQANNGLEWLGSQSPSIIQPDDDAIVGDYDGDGRDEILLYNSSNGNIQLIEAGESTGFQQHPQFDPDNISPYPGPGLKVRAGDFNSDNMTDLLFITNYGQLIRYDSILLHDTLLFFYVFTTSLSTTKLYDKVSVARIDDNESDDIVIHNTVTGVTSFFECEYIAGALLPITTVESGSLYPPYGSYMFWCTLKNEVYVPGFYRHDVLMYDLLLGKIKRLDAGYENGNYTYTHIYQHQISDYHSEWPEVEEHTWLVVKGKFADKPGEPANDDFFRAMFTRAGEESTYDYYKDISYGSLLANAEVQDGWNFMAYTLDESRDRSRRQKIRDCIDASGIDPSDYRAVIAIINEQIDAGHAGNVLLDPNTWNITFAAHEMGHEYGLPDSYDDSNRINNKTSEPGQYFDHWDIMSAMAVLTFPDARGLASGPEMNAPNKMKKSWIPENRILKLVSDNGRSMQRVDIAVINRPEVRGVLAVKIKMGSDKYFTIEYRQPAWWDRGIPKQCVLIHEVKNGISYLRTRGTGYDAEWNIGEIFEDPGDNLQIKVNEFNTTEGTANVTVIY